MKKTLSVITCIIMLICIFTFSVFAYNTYSVEVSIVSDFTKSFDGEAVKMQDSDLAVTGATKIQLENNDDIRYLWYSEDGTETIGSDGPSAIGWYKVAVELKIWDEWVEKASRYFEIKDGDTHVHYYVFRCDEDCSTHMEYCPGCADVRVSEADHRYTAHLNYDSGYSVTYDFTCEDCGYVNSVVGVNVSDVKGYDCPMTSVSWKEEDFPGVVNMALNVKMIPENYENSSKSYITGVVNSVNESSLYTQKLRFTDIPLILELSLKDSIGNPVVLNGSKSVTVEVMLGKQNYELLKNGDANLLLIKENDAENVTIDNFIDETYSVRFTTSSMGTFAVVNQDVEDDYGRAYLSAQTNGDGLVAMYDQIFEQVAVFASPVNVDIPENCQMGDITTVIDAYCRDNGEQFWLEHFDTYLPSENSIALNPVYFNGLPNNAAKAEFEENAYYLLEEAGITPGNVSSYSQNELALRIHDVIIDNVEYNQDLDDENAYNYCAYGAIVDGLTCCEGYSEAYQYLLGLVGIKSHLITGYSGELHKWIIVKIDGYWYETDITWDDPVTTEPLMFHAYYNLTEAEMAADHVNYVSYTLPERNSHLRYYDIPEYSSLGVTSETMLDEIVSQLSSGAEYATVFITDGTDISDWLYDNENSNLFAICDALGITGEFQLEILPIRDEYHIYIYKEINVSYDTSAHYEIVESHGIKPDENDIFTLRSGKTFRFGITFDEGYCEGDDFTVTVNGVELTKDSAGLYETGLLFDDTVIVVTGIEQKQNLGTIGSIVINNNSDSYVGAVLQRTSYTGFEDGTDIKWQWFLDNEPYLGAGEYSTLMVTSGMAGHSIKLRASAYESDVYIGYVDSNWVEIITLEEPTLTVEAKAGLTYDMAVITFGNIAGKDIRYTTNSSGDVTAAWYSYGSGVVNEENRLSGLPKNAGKYFVVVTVASDGVYSEKTVTLEFEIAKLSGGQAQAPTLSSKGARSLTVNTTINQGVRQRYLIRPVSNPAYGPEDDNEWGWIDPTGSTYTFDYNLEPYTTYRIYTYWPGTENFGPTSVTYTDFTTLPEVFDIPAEDTTAFVYNGEEQTYTIAENAGYTITGLRTKTNAGTTQIVVSLVDKVHSQWSDSTTADKVYDFTINPKAITLDMIEVEESDAENSVFGATGEAIKPAVTITDGDVQLVEDVDYTLSYHIDGNIGRYGDPAFIGVGYYSIDITAKEDGNYSGTLNGDDNAELQYTIVKSDYLGETISGRIVIRTNKSPETRISLLTHENWTNLPLKATLTNCVRTAAEPQLLWSFDVNDIVINGDLTSLAGTYYEATVTLESNIYNPIEGVTLRIEFEEPPLVTELELVEDSGLTITSVEGLGKLLRGFAHKQSVDTLKSKYEHADMIKVFAADGETEITGTALVGTGCCIKLYNEGAVIDEVKVVVMGDVDGDGKVSSTDALNALKASAGLTTLGKLYAYAGNIDHDDKITSGEALKILKYSAGILETLE